MIVSHVVPDENLQRSQTSTQNQGKVVNSELGEFVNELDPLAEDILSPKPPISISFRDSRPFPNIIIACPTLGPGTMVLPLFN